MNVETAAILGSLAITSRPARLVRLGSAALVAVYAVAYDPVPGFPEPPWVALVTTSIAAVLAATAFVVSRRTSFSVIVFTVTVDLAAAMTIVVVHAFDPRRYLFVVVILVLLEAAVLLGRPALLAWVAATVANGVLDLAAISGVEGSVTALAVRSGVALAVVLIGIMAHRAILDEELVRGDRDRLFDLSSELLCVTGFDGYFKKLNPAWERVLGYTIDELLAEPFIEFVHPDDRDATAQEAVDATERAMVSFENRFRCKDGTYRTLLWTATPWPAHERIYAAARDVTDRVEAEQQRLRSRDELLSRVSHELRTPLAAVSGFITVLQDGIAGPVTDEQDHYLAIAKRNALELGGLIEDLLDVARAREGKLILRPIPCALGGLLSETAGTFEPLASERGLELSLNVEAALPPALVDPPRFRQVVSNLVSNALKFTPTGGSVSIEAARDDGFVRVAVHDTGPGIPPGDVESVFERMFQHERETSDDASRIGLGLGLHIAKELVVLMGGRIWAGNRPEGGTTFAFVVPVADGDDDG